MVWMMAEYTVWISLSQVSLGMTYNQVMYNLVNTMTKPRILCAWKIKSQRFFSGMLRQKFAVFTS